MENVVEVEKIDYFLHNYYYFPVEFRPNYLGYVEPGEYEFEEVWSRKVG